MISSNCTIKIFTKLLRKICEIVRKWKTIKLCVSDECNSEYNKWKKEV